MLSILLLATLAVAPASIAPITVEFTNDSVYKYESIISPKDVIEEESGLYTIVLEEDKLLGYAIYDNSETDYIDGLKFDDDFVKGWTIEHVDLNVEHKIYVKTVYTDDVAGMLASAKDGDWSRIIANPLILFQIFYYSLAAISLIIGGIGLFKAKAKKVKDHNEIAKAVENKSIEVSEALKAEAIGLVTSILTPALTQVKTSNDAIIKALIMSQSGDKNSTLGLIELLNGSASINIDGITEDIKKSINDKFDLKEKTKKQVQEAVTKIATGNFNGSNGSNGEGGISI